MSQHKPLLFSTEKYDYLKNKIALKSGENIEIGAIDIQIFPDEERYMRLITNVKDRDVYLLGGTISNDDTLEIFDIASAIAKNGANSLSLIIPYFGYSTMERAVKEGEVVTAKNRALLLSSIPKSIRGNKVYLFDLHSEGIPHYFENNTIPIHIYCKEIVMQAAHDLAGNDFVLASTDAGRAKWVESLANDMGVNAAFVFKRRVSGNETHVTSISADVQNKKVVIYDDMIRTGGSLLNAAKAYKEFGAKEIYVITTHGLFVGEAIKKLKDGGIIEKVICTDTHPNAQTLNEAFFQVYSIDTLIASLIKEQENFQ